MFWPIVIIIAIGLYIVRDSIGILDKTRIHTTKGLISLDTNVYGFCLIDRTPHHVFISIFSLTTCGFHSHRYQLIRYIPPSHYKIVYSLNGEVRKSPYEIGPYLSLKKGMFEIQKRCKGPGFGSKWTTILTTTDWPPTDLSCL